jgi:hypothetical protein
MQVTYRVEAAGGLRQAIIRTRVQDLFATPESCTEGGRPDTRRTTIERAEVVVMDHAILADDGQQVRTGGAASADCIIQALRDDAFRPAWSLVSETEERI